MSIWRTELIHPLSIHMPIACFVLSVTLTLFALIARNRSWAPRLRYTATLLLTIGVLTGWIATFTGDMAKQKVITHLCQTDILALHEEYALWALYAFSAALVLRAYSFWSAQRLMRIPRIISVGLLSCELILLGAGVGCLGESIGAGAQLVYSQGAGVMAPAECH